VPSHIFACGRAALRTVRTAAPRSSEPHRSCIRGVQHCAVCCCRSQSRHDVMLLPCCHPQGLVPLLNNPAPPVAVSGWWPLSAGVSGADALAADSVPPPLAPGRLPTVNASDFNRHVGDVRFAASEQRLHCCMSTADTRADSDLIERDPNRAYSWVAPAARRCTTDVCGRLRDSKMLFSLTQTFLQSLDAQERVSSSLSATGTCAPWARRTSGSRPTGRRRTRTTRSGGSALRSWRQAAAATARRPGRASSPPWPRCRRCTSRNTSPSAGEPLLSPRTLSTACFIFCKAFGFGFARSPAHFVLNLMFPILACILSGADAGAGRHADGSGRGGLVTLSP